MQHTANYGLKKPMGTDVVNIMDLNDNADIIDQQLKENSDAVDTKETPAGAQAKADSAETKAKAYADSITPTKVSQLTNDKGYIAASGAPVQSVNGKTGVVSLGAANVGAAPAAHVNDTTKHITSAERNAWNAKPSSQRGVSDSISSTSSSVAASLKAVKTAYDKGVSAYNLASTKEAAFSKNNAFNKAFGTASGTVCQGNDSRLSNSRKCNNTFDNASTARTNLGLTGTSNTTHYHDSRYVQTRVYNGKLQYYDGGWKNAGSDYIESAVASNTERVYKTATRGNSISVVSLVGGEIRLYATWTFHTLNSHGYFASYHNGLRLYVGGSLVYESPAGTSSGSVTIDLAIKKGESIQLCFNSYTVTSTGVLSSYCSGTASFRCDYLTSDEIINKPVV